MEKDTVVVVNSQCPKGRVDLLKYQVGKALYDVGVISAGDMTVEATVTKLSYLFGRKLSLDQIRTAMGTNLRGELTLESF